MSRASAALAFALAACGEPGAPSSPTTKVSPPGRIPSAMSAPSMSAAARSDEANAKAIRFVLGEWERILGHLPADRASWGVAVDAAIHREAPHFAVQRVGCAEKRRFLSEVVADIGVFELDGDASRLERPGECTAVYFSGGMKLDVEFILDDHAGELLFAWRVPEG